MEQTIEIEGLRMRYDRIGQGPQAVIVMHGWGCNASTVQVLADAAAAPSTTVYNLDLPGFGGSQEPPASWGVYDYAHFIESFAARLGIERPVLIGHSYGGRIAIVYASESPVEKVILVDAAGIKPRRSLRYYIKIYTFKAAKRILPLLLGRRKGGEDTHEQICGEVHHVAHHAEHGVAFELIAPYCSDRGGKVGNERNHGKEEEHGDDSHHVCPLRGRSLYSFFHWYCEVYLLF